MGAALVYMGHGNDYFSTGIYAELQREMNTTYDVPVFAACVEGYPAFDDILAGLKAAKVKNILLKPLMVVAGDHASNDMAGDEDDAWKVMLTKGRVPGHYRPDGPGRQQRLGRPLCGPP